jgi:hypothetical protein
MKKLFILFSLSLGISIGAFAQASTLTDCLGPVHTSTHGAGSTPGLSPSDSVLPCAVIGSLVNDTIVFVNYTSVPLGGSQVPLTSLTIDSLYLPAGLCWSTSSATNTFLAGDSGYLYVTGSPTDSAGQYKLRIIVTADVSGIMDPDINAESATGLAYRVRVIAAGCGCPTIDNSHADSAEVYIKYDTCASPNVGIHEIANNLTNVSVTPNPFTSTASVSFTSDITGSFTMKMMNLLGEVVATKDLNIVHGTNQTTIERNGLNSGIYILSISNGSSAISRKVIID